jgi:hypothetical protein
MVLVQFCVYFMLFGNYFLLHEIQIIFFEFYFMLSDEYLCGAGGGGLVSALGRASLACGQDAHSRRCREHWAEAQCYKLPAPPAGLRVG